jgi:carboxylesterase type B
MIGICILALVFIVNTNAADVVVQIEDGKIRGRQFANGLAFLGVPYARAPLREHRFMVGDES